MGLLLYEFRTSNVILTVSEQRYLFSAILCLNFLFTNSSSAFSSILSTNSCLRISKIRFIIPMFLMFIYISRYKDLFFFGLQCFGRFPIIQSSSSCPFTFIYSSIFPMLFFGSQALCKHFNYYYSHAMSQRQFNAASSWAIAASCFCSNYSYSNYRVTFYATRDWRGSSIYILITNWGFYKQAFVMVNSVIIRKFFTTTIIMPAFLKFLFWMSSDWLHFSDSKFHYGSLSATQ